MKEIVSTAFNILAIIDSEAAEPQLTPSCELVIVAAERECEFEYGPDGKALGVVRALKLSTHRFAISPKQLNALAADCIARADLIESKLDAAVANYKRPPTETQKQ